jgi:predicted acylesterase/phospholipase RssA
MTTEPTTGAGRRKISTSRISGRARLLSLALQGDGAFGAFTWCVLDGLLETEEIAFDALSSSGAGAVNAVVLAPGLARGDRIAARERLERVCDGPVARPPSRLLARNYRFFAIPTGNGVVAVVTATAHAMWRAAGKGAGGLPITFDICNDKTKLTPHYATIEVHVHD